MSKNGEAEPLTTDLMRELLCGTETKIKNDIKKIDARVAANTEALDNLEKKIDLNHIEVRKTVQDLVRKEVSNLRTGPPAHRRDRKDGELDPEDERSYWKARCSLRVWPIPGPALMQSATDFFRNKLKLDKPFCDKMGAITCRPIFNPRSKIKDEATRTFETKQVRDAVKAATVNLAGRKGEAGIRIDVPEFLESQFRSLMSIGYDLKQKHKDCKRSIKFDDDKKELVMDVRLDEDSGWKRVCPQAANKVREARPSAPTNQTSEAGDEELSQWLT